MGRHMRTLILIAVMMLPAIAISLAIQRVTRTYDTAFDGGKDVKARFLERGCTIPSSEKAITAANLKEWVQANPDAAKKYVTPVIFPLDMLFVLAAGVFLGFASVLLAGRIDTLSFIPMWVWWILPALYMIADICEGAAMISLLSRPDLIGGYGFAALRALTFTKLVTITLAISQVLGLAAWALHSCLCSKA